MIGIVLSLFMVVEASPPISQYPVPANEATYLALALAQEQIQLAMEEANFSDRHPTLIRRRQQVASLQQALAQQSEPINQRLVQSVYASAAAQAKTELAAAMEGFAIGHPRVQLQFRRLERLRAFAAQDAEQTPAP